MLFVLFGSTAEMGRKSREFFINHGFELIQKYNYVPDDFMLKERFGERKRVSKDQVLKCDFTYENNGMIVGFNKDQIIDAVRGRKQCILTASASTIDFVKQIKAAYGEYVTVIGTYIDENTLRSLSEALSDVQAEEVERRIETGRQIKRFLLEDRKIFDHIVIYGGENSLFNFNALAAQYEFMIDKATIRERELNNKMYVEIPYAGQEDYIFVSYSHADVDSVFPVLRNLQLAGCRVWYDEGINGGENWRKILESKIQSENCRDFLLFSSANSTESIYVRDEVKVALQFNKKIVPIRMDSSTFMMEIEDILQNYQSLDAQKENFHDKLLRSIEPSTKIANK